MRQRKIGLIFGILVGPFVVVVFQVRASMNPTAVVENAVDSVINTLKRYPCTEKKTCQKQKECLHEIAGSFIDFDRVGQMTLGRYKRRFSKEEWEEFKVLFRELLEDVYIKRLREYSGEKIIFENERVLSSNRAQVDTKVVSSSRAISVSYRLMKKDGCWRVYDILVEGVSLLRNYRQQFFSLLRSKSPSDLNEILRKKVDFLRKEGE